VKNQVVPKTSVFPFGQSEGSPQNPASIAQKAADRRLPQGGKGLVTIPTNASAPATTSPAGMKNRFIAKTQG
jgi:hypothetical protein